MDTRQREKEKDKEKDMAPGEGTPKVSGVADDLIGLVAGLLCGYIHSLYLFRSAYSVCLLCWIGLIRHGTLNPGLGRFNNQVLGLWPDFP